MNYAKCVISFLTLLLIPVAMNDALSQSVNDDYPISNSTLAGLISGGTTVGPVGIVNELHQAHSDLTGIMEGHSAGSYEHDYPFTITYVDEEEKILVVGMHPMAAVAGIKYNVNEIQHALETGAPIKIIYAEFIAETSSSAQTYYEANCTPDVLPGFINVCKAYADILIGNGINPADLGAYTIFLEEFSNMRNWNTSGDDIEDDDLGSNYGVIPGHTTRNDVATNDDECGPCTITMREGIDISGYDHITLTFWKLIDDDFESDDYLKVEVYDGSAWAEKFKWTSGDSLWQQHTLRLDDTASFKMRITAQIADEDNKFGIDNIILKVENDDQDITPADTTPPVIMIPADITGVPRSSLGYYAEFDVTATDSIDGTVNVTCSHSTGYFQIGVTTVSCNAADAAGNRASESFSITVTDGRPADTDGDGFHDEIDRCPDEASDGNYGCPEVPVQTTTKVYAGIEHIYEFDYYSGSDSTRSLLSKVERGTIGFTGYKTDGTKGFVASAHIFQPVDAFYRALIPQNHEHRMSVPGSSNNIMSTSSPESNWLSYGQTRSFDAAFVPITNSSNFIPSNQLKMNNGTVVDLIQGSTNDVSFGDTVFMYGKETNSEGLLLFKNATITTYDFHQNRYTMSNQHIANYDSIGGDSGAPVIIFSREVAKIVGIHSGIVCQFSAESEGQTEINLWGIVNGERVCSGSFSNYYKVFSSWDSIKDGLRIR